MAIKWVTEEQVLAAAEKSDRAALAMSLRHWKQLAAVRMDYLIAAFHAHQVDCGPDLCALCQRHQNRAFQCGSCPVQYVGGVCVQVGTRWQRANVEFDVIVTSDNPGDWWGEWKTAARAMRDLLQRLYDKGKKGGKQ